MRLSGFLVLFVGFAVSCSSPANPSGTTAGPTATSISITGGVTLNVAGQKSQLTATVTFSDGTTQDVTTTATWQSSNTGIATVSSSGIVTAVAAGNVTVTATYAGKSTTVNIAISFSTATGNTLTATIDGVAFNGLAVSVAHVAGILSVGGVSGFTGQYISLAFAFPDGIGSYSVGPTAIANGQVQIPNSAASWVSTAAGSNGTITVTSVTANSASGTLSMNLMPLKGTAATGTKVVASGTFNVKF